MKPDPPLTKGSFKSKIESFKKAKDTLVAETKKSKQHKTFFGDTGSSKIFPKTIDQMNKITKEFKTSTNLLKTATERYKTAKAK